MTSLQIIHLVFVAAFVLFIVLTVVSPKIIVKIIKGFDPRPKWNLGDPVYYQYEGMMIVNPRMIELKE